MHAAAFAPSEVEAPLLDALRADGDLIAALSLVAERDGAIVGHVAISRAWIGATEVLALGPDRRPARAPAGTGRRRGADATRCSPRPRRPTYPLVALLGHADYYPRFGFEPAGPLGHAPASSRRRRRAWLAFTPARRTTRRSAAQFRYADAFLAAA